MRHLAGLVLVGLLAAQTPSATPQSGMKPADRQRLIAHLEMTEAWLAAEVAALSDRQLKWRAADDKWSVLDVVEHLAVAEPQYWDNLQKSLAQPVTDEKMPATDADILWYGIDRTNRQKTGEARTAKGRYSDLKTPLGEFRALRARMLEVARNSQEDMRGRKLIGGNMSVYQWFLMISSHSQRHILQIQEIKRSPGYPR